MLRLGAISAISLWATDWSIKAAQPLFDSSGWVPHYTSRSLWLIPLGLITLIVLSLMINTRLVIILSGLVFGGLCANILELSFTGVVWNMIYVPFTNGLYCDLADLAIVGGILTLLTITVLYAWRLY